MVLFILSVEVLENKVWGFVQELNTRYLLSLLLNKMETLGQGVLFFAWNR